MKYLAIMLLWASVASAQDKPWQVVEPEMSKAPPSELDKALAKFPPVKPMGEQPARKPKTKPRKIKPEWGMTRYQVWHDTVWGRPIKTQRIVDENGTWDMWTYKDGVVWFLDDALTQTE
jgi:hypothetical protein